MYHSYRVKKGLFTSCVFPPVRPVLSTQPASVHGRAPTGTRVTTCPASVCVTLGWPARGVIDVLDGGLSSPDVKVNPPRRLQP
jgi:hypothetical protein